MGFVWDAVRHKFLFWPGSYFAYEPAGSPILNYAKGFWTFDPATNGWTQSLGIFGNQGESTGSLSGGIYDDVNDQLVAFGDDTVGPAVRRWSVGSQTRLADLPLAVARVAGQAAIYMRTKYVKIGRYVYIAGYRTDGASLRVPAFWRWHLDNRTFEELPPPPVNPAGITDLEIRLATSFGKVVWPYITGPDGEINGIYVFNPATNAWYVDRQVPSYGNFIGNALTSLPDGRVVWSGGEFGRQQTHIWFYSAP